MAASAFAQETQRFKTITIDSEVLNQERNLKVSLRQNFSEEKNIRLFTASIFDSGINDVEIFFGLSV